MSDTSRRDAGQEPEVTEEEGFLERWSRRKAEAGRGAAPDRDPDRIETPAEATPAEVAPAEVGPVPCGGDVEAELPAIESLTDHSDYSAFLAPNVDPDLRRKALRRLFSAAKFNFRDGLDDYCRDYRSWTPLGDVITADMKLQAMRRLERELAAAGEPGPAAGEPVARAPAVEKPRDEDRPGSEADDGEHSDDHPA